MSQQSFEINQSQNQNCVLNCHLMDNYLYKNVNLPQTFNNNVRVMDSAINTGLPFSKHCEISRHFC